MWVRLSVSESFSSLCLLREAFLKRETDRFTVVWRQKRFVTRFHVGNAFRLHINIVVVFDGNLFVSDDLIPLWQG
jgi:hypothetical protein